MWPEGPYAVRRLSDHDFPYVFRGLVNAPWFLLVWPARFLIHQSAKEAEEPPRKISAECLQTERLGDIQRGKSRKTAKMHCFCIFQEMGTVDACFGPLID